jgi:CheY-like chemotaxis protein
LCLLDIGLPDITGFELARRLRALPQTARATLVAVTGYGRREDRAQADQAGFDHYFVKPVDVDALLALIARLP